MLNQTEFELPGHRHIQLVALNQSFTEEGRLEGLPTKEGNRRRLEWLAKEPPTGSLDIAHVILPPVETLIAWDDVEPYPFGTPARLPHIMCVARFRSLRPARNPQYDFSQLVVTWFQDGFAFPIDASIREQITQIDWNSLASDFEY